MPAVLSPTKSKRLLSPALNLPPPAKRDLITFTPKKPSPKTSIPKVSVKERKERLYEVSVAAGLSYLKLDATQWLEPFHRRTQKQAEREAAERQNR